MADFRMPSLGAGMESGILRAWRVEPGDRVKRGDIVAEVETEKGIIEIETFSDGVVTALVASEDTKVPVGALLARIEETADETGPVTAGQIALPSSTFAEPPRAGPAREDRQSSTPAARQLAREAGIALAEVEGTGPHGTVTRADVLSALEPSVAPPRDRRVSPYARARASALGVDLGAVAPGPDGVVHAAEVERAALAPPRAEVPGDRAAVDPQAAMRRAIAVAMSTSKREIPHYYLAHTIDLGPAMAWLARENQARAVPDRLLSGVLLLAAVAKAAREVPEINARWAEDRAILLDRLHLGVAISLRRGGLIAPAIHDADRCSLSELMKRLSELVTRVRSGTMRGSELTDATLTVTSLGDRGVDTVFPIINPPQAAMVGFGKIVERPWVVDGAVVARPTVTATLAADHRVSDGHRGGLFLASVERWLSHPEEL